MWLKLLNLLISHPSSDLCTGSRLMNALNINSSHSPTKFLQPANLTTYTILSLFSLPVELAPRLLLPYLDLLIFLITNQSPTALSYMHHLTCGISSLLYSVNLILFTVLLVHLILRISQPSLSSPITASTFQSRLYLKLISFRNVILHSHSYSSRTDFMSLNLYWIKGALALFVLASDYMC